MKEQVDALERLGFRAALFNSTLSDAERTEILRKLRRGELEAPAEVTESDGRVRVAQEVHGRSPHASSLLILRTYRCPL